MKQPFKGMILQEIDLADIVDKDGITNVEDGEVNKDNILVYKTIVTVVYNDLVSIAKNDPDNEVVLDYLAKIYNNFGDLIHFLDDEQRRKAGDKP